jgi:uncharacterized protein YbjT (DUF2867 family)
MTDETEMREEGSTMIAVLGAAGHVGGTVAELLLEQNEEIRVLEHGRPLRHLAERGAQVVRGDAGHGDALRTLFAGAGAALVLLPEDVTDPRFEDTRSRIGHMIAEALDERAVRYVVALSAVSVGRKGIAGPPAGLAAYEQRLSGLSGTNVLVLRSAFYMDYLLMNLPLIESQKVNGSAIAADLAFPMIATRDVAREAAERLHRRDFTGHQARLLLGPEDVSMREATRAIGERLGIPDLPYVEFPPESVEEALRAAGMTGEVARLLVEMQLALNAGAFYAGIERTPGPTMPTRLADFLATALPGKSRA